MFSLRMVERRDIMSDLATFARYVSDFRVVEVYSSRELRDFVAVYFWWS